MIPFNPILGVKRLLTGTPNPIKSYWLLMKPITPQFRDAGEYILGVVLLLIAFVIILAGSRSAFNGIRIYTLQAYSLLEQPLGSFKSYKSALVDNTRLRQQNVVLQDELNRLRAAAKENERLRKLLDFQERTSTDLIPSLVVGKELTGIHNFLTITIPDSVRISKGNPIISEDGLIGQVIATTADYAQVMPFFSNLYRVSGLIHGKTSSYGIISWQGNNYNELFMRYVPATVDIQIGDLVVTSGYSNIYPPNIPIGTVVRVERNQGIETQQIYLEPSVSLFDITEVFILPNSLDTSRLNLTETYKAMFN